MKKKPNVVLSKAIPGTLKHRDIIQHTHLYMVTLDGNAITIAVIDDDISHWVTPRYTNNVYSQKQSAENAAAKLNREFNTTAFVVKQVALV